MLLSSFSTPAPLGFFALDEAQEGDADHAGRDDDTCDKADEKSKRECQHRDAFKR